MNFASWSFLCLFLPLALLLFHLLRGSMIAHRQIFLTFASFGFYAWSGASNALILAGSIIFNFAIGRWLTTAEKHRKLGLWSTVAGNLGLLLAFKVAALDSVGPDGFRSTEIILIPLALSFITFQQIGFVVSCYRRQIKAVPLADYLFFVCFFPQLVLGPIVRYQDIVSQLKDKALAQVNATDVGVGLSIFIFGLTKKVMLADQLGMSVDRIFTAAALNPTSSAEAWFAIVAFQLQLFLDFSAYAEMAIGLARMFGMRLPINFDRPHFSIDRFDLWRRWHITFATFMRTNVFMPLVRTRRFGPATALAITAMLSGLWHGLGWTFILWGLIQTGLMLATHYRNLKNRQTTPLTLVRHFRAIALTFITTCLVGAMFRSPTLDSVFHIYGALFGVSLSTETGISLIGNRGYIFFPLAVLAVWFLPDAQQFFRRYWSVIDPRSDGRSAPIHWQERWLPYRLNAFWALALGLALVASMVFLNTAQRFVYVQF
ncbi:MAG: MBOAT family O-acyltransferase [Sphingopyxis sp.]